MRPFLSMRLVVLCIAAVAALALAGSASAERYIVLYKEYGFGNWSAKSDVKRAGGSVVATYPQIDVVIAESSDPDFVKDMDRLRSVEGVASVGSVVASASGFGFDGGSHGLDNKPVADTDTFAPLQWYAQRIKAPEAHKVTGGSPEVTVGVIDTGVDATHPDLDGNVDASRSVSCVRRRAEPGSGGVERRLRARHERGRHHRRGGERPGHRRYRPAREAGGHQGRHPLGRE